MLRTYPVIGCLSRYSQIQCTLMMQKVPWLETLTMRRPCLPGQTKTDLKRVVLPCVFQVSRNNMMHVYKYHNWGNKLYIRKVGCQVQSTDYRSWTGGFNGVLRFQKHLQGCTVQHRTSQFYSLAQSSPVKAFSTIVWFYTNIWAEHRTKAQVELQELVTGLFQCYSHVKAAECIMLTINSLRKTGWPEKRGATLNHQANASGGPLQPYFFIFNSWNEAVNVQQQ